MSIRNTYLIRTLVRGTISTLVSLAFVIGAQPVQAQSSIDVLIYDGPASSGVLLGRVVADQARPDVNQAMSISGNHGFSWTVPDSVKNGQIRNLYVYGVNDNPQGSNTLLSNAPMSIQCSLPPQTCTDTNASNYGQPLPCTYAPSPAPSVFIQASPTSVSWWFGGTTELIWSSSGANSCTASGDWSGAKSVNGSELVSISSFSSAKTYTITCSNSVGSDSSSVTVNIGSSAAQCADGNDNDNDGKVDMADPGCANATDNDETDPAEPPPPTDLCQNIPDVQTSIPTGYHRDGVDCVPDTSDWCPNIPEVQLSLPVGMTVNAAGQCVGFSPQCSDSIDNDSDGKTDFPADIDCTSADDDGEAYIPQCSDSIDNDSDGKTDFPADINCTSALDDNESAIPQCADGLDNDNDGKIDLVDPGCANATDDTENTDRQECTVNCGSDGGGGNGGPGGSGGPGGNNGNVSGFTVSGTSKLAIQFLGGIGAMSQTANISVNPVSNFAAPVRLSVQSIRSIQGTDLPSDVTPTYYFGGNEASSMLMSYDSNSGYYVNTNGLIGTTFAVKLSKKITDKYYITLVGVSGVQSASMLIELNPNAINPDFREI